MKMKKIGPSGGSRPWRSPWIRQWSQSFLLGKGRAFSLKIPEDDDSTRACLHFVFKLVNIVNIQVTIVEFIIIVPGCN